MKLPQQDHGLVGILSHHVEGSAGKRAGVEWLWGQHLLTTRATERDGSEEYQGQQTPRAHGTSIGSRSPVAPPYTARSAWFIPRDGNEERITQTVFTTL